MVIIPVTALQCFLVGGMSVVRTWWPNDSSKPPENYDYNADFDSGIPLLTCGGILMVDFAVTIYFWFRPSKKGICDKSSPVQSEVEAPVQSKAKAAAQSEAKAAVQSETESTVQSETETE